MRLGFRRGGLRLGLLGLFAGSVMLTLLVGSTAASPLVVPSGGCVRPGNGPDLTCTFDYTGAVESWTVPSGVSSATFDLFGASGGFSGPQGRGWGGEVQADVPVTPGEQLDVTVGQGGDPGGAFGGGGAAGAGASGSRDPGGGGGASRVERAGPTVLLVAGGGGGSTGGLGGKGGATDSTGDGQNGPGGAGGGKSGAAGGAGGAGDQPNSCGAGQTPVDGGAGSASSDGIGGTGGEAVGPFNNGSPGGGGGGGYV